MAQNDSRTSELTDSSSPADHAESRRSLSLSWKLLFLTIVFVMASEVLIYVPTVANFRLTWLSDHLAMADAASTLGAGGLSRRNDRSTK